MAPDQNKVTTLPRRNEELTLDDLRNLVAFGNRATMNGAEADTWVSLKRKLLARANELAQERPEDIKAGGSE